jgi:multiple sugar transport system ATP-binding protein
MIVAGLTVKNLSKRFGDLRVLDDVSFEMGERELLVLLGPSGCGKSTVLRLIAGLEEADAGEIHIGGRQVEKLRPRERNVALVFQNYSLYPHMTVAENLGFPLSVAKVKKAEIADRVAQVAQMLDLTERLKSRPAQLSGGQRQRVALGRAIIREPALFLLDEPLSNLDAELRVRMRQEIVALQRRLGKPMIHVTHDQTEALTMADRIALLHKGRLLQLGTPSELYRAPASRFVAEFIGTPRINILSGQVTEGRVSPFKTPVPNGLGSRSAVDVGIRAEGVELSEQGPFAATVAAVEYLGDHYVVSLDFQGQRLVSTHGPARPPQAGDTVRFAVNPDGLLFFDKDSGGRL